MPVKIGWWLQPLFGVATQFSLLTCFFYQNDVSISVFYTVFLGELGRKVGKLVNLYQIWTWRPIIRPIIHQRVMLEGPESPKSHNKLVLPENVADNNINWAFLCD